MTSSNGENMRKLLNVISEDGPLAPGAFIDPVAGPDMTTDEPDMGNVTKIEVTMKDGEEVEVEVYAQQDELSRLMDLAGQFHKDKQSGMMSAPDMAPDMGMEPDMAPDMGMEPEIDAMAMPPEGGPDLPVGSEIDDISLDMDDTSEVDFAMGDEEPVSMEENITKKHDFGHPNPMQGQEEYELSAFAFQGGASKPVRFVPARSGDNPMVDTSDRKGLREYVDDVVSGKKKDIDENLNDPKEKAKAAVAAATSGIEIDDKTLDDMTAAAVDTANTTSSTTDDGDAAGLAIQTAKASGTNIKPNDEKKIEDNIKKLKTDEDISVNPDFKMNIVDEEELAERKRRYSFSHAEFGRGIVTSPEAKRKRSARRGLSIYNK